MICVSSSHRHFLQQLRRKKLTLLQSGTARGDPETHPECVEMIKTIYYKVCSQIIFFPLGFSMSLFFSISWRTRHHR